MGRETKKKKRRMNAGSEKEIETKLSIITRGKRLKIQRKRIFYSNSLAKNKITVENLAEFEEMQISSIDDEGLQRESQIKPTRCTLDEEAIILTINGRYFDLVMNKKWFSAFVHDFIAELFKNNKPLKFKKKAIYFIHHLSEEYLVFWFSQLEKISEFSKRKTVMKADCELYDLLINRLLQFDNLCFIKKILKRAEISQGVRSTVSEEDENISKSADEDKGIDQPTK